MSQNQILQSQVKQSIHDIEILITNSIKPLLETNLTLETTSELQKHIRKIDTYAILLNIYAIHQNLKK